MCCSRKKFQRYVTVATVPKIQRTPLNEGTLPLPRKAPTTWITFKVAPYSFTIARALRK